MQSADLHHFRAIRFRPSVGTMSRSATLVVSALAVLLATASTSASDPWADSVHDYIPGSNPVAGYSQPLTALGSPERFTGEGVYPGAVTIFNPSWGFDEIVSIGAGGQLTLRFDEPVLDDPTNLYGVDLIVFGNAGFISELAAPQIVNPALLFGAGGALIEVSADGLDFEPVNALADHVFPTQGYLDVGPFDTLQGSVLSDFLRPVNPALTLSDFDGLSYEQALALYDGSGGGAPVDIASTGLSSIQFVRISVPAGAQLAAEIDAIAAVPEPGSALLILAVLPFLRRSPVRTR
jgi:hypothetical protein